MRITQIVQETTTSGSVATVSQPIGNMQKRMGNKKGGSMFAGKTTNKPFYEAEISEQDLILVPGQGRRMKPGFISKAADRTDREVEMALGDLFQAAKNAKMTYDMLKDISEDEGIEGWVQEKIIKASDYLNTIREYLENKRLQSEGTMGALAGGVAGAYLGKSPSAAITGAEIGSELQDTFTTEGMDPEQRSRLGDLIDQYKASTDPEYDSYNTDDEYLDSDEIIAQIRSEFGDRIAGQVESGYHKMHFGRTGHAQGYDPLSWKKANTRVTKGGKMYKQDSDYMKNTIKSRYKLGGKSATESVAEGKEELHAKLKAINHKIKMMRGGPADQPNSAAFVEKRQALMKQKKEIEAQLKQDMTEGERNMSRAAKGYEKYGKEGMQALAKAGREGKDLDKIRNKYNKYD